MNSETCLSCEAIERYFGEEEERVHALRGVSLDMSRAVSTRLLARPAVARARCSTFSGCSICRCRPRFNRIGASLSAER